MDAREGRARRSNLQPDLGILRNLDGLECLLPGLCRLVMQVEPPCRCLRAPPDQTELSANAGLGVFGQRDVAAKNMEHRRFSPVERVAEIEVDRPVLGQFRPGLDLYHGPPLGVAVNAGSKPVGTLAFDAAEDRNRADDMIATAIERYRAAINKTGNIAVGPDPKHQNAPIHAANTFIDGCKPPRNVALDLRRARRTTAFH